MIARGISGFSGSCGGLTMPSVSTPCLPASTSPTWPSSAFHAPGSAAAELSTPPTADAPMRSG